MMTDFWWIGEVDHRISTALIFFVLLLLLGNKNRREHFMLRASGALAVLTAFSWTMRYAIENCLTDTFAQGIGQSIYLLVMSLLFMGCYALCYRASTAECIYFDLLSVTIYKIAWNTFK